ncbi:uncharacterized protein A1O9_04983 [Exophiala aquamarina CBS 119918]|uniref:Something about silencing protein 4 domain-containing protein n=1 Tax=Exophiala aquamarina CBS 119918 TaxID=1182545 RepID=A0A072PLA5_9EURO|nr:uncharacterized protein A1O9_04983 [Exophiala aquamarina CBS 119918]KEF60133.1 hypothetical protein A1O9_04983 [Exophiala aquamarina CBS 119918]
MVAGSRSSLRRPTLRSSEETPPLLSQSRDSGNAVRSKRVRASTVIGQEQNLKRRRLSENNNEIPHLRIPLRSRGGPKLISPAVPPTGISTTDVSTNPSIGATALESPSGKPQYEQIKIIEARAKASIRGGSLAPSHDDRRKLRSEDGGSRAKTELAQYFPDFEEMLSLKPVDPEALTVKTRVILVDDTPDFEPNPPKPDPFGARKPLHRTEIIQLSQRGTSSGISAVDPLDGDVYIRIHSKAERHEKQMKNGDRERAQHEKYQLEKLLDDLRGPDWLKTLGITGITDTEKKRYEPKRLLFIRETQALINKFKRWKEEEKRRKWEKEQALLEEEMEQESAESESESERGSVSSSNEGSIQTMSSQAPNSSELDALASQQLIEEANIAIKRKRPAVSRPVDPPPPPPPPPPLPPQPLPRRPFVSFFEKRHLRDAAVAGRQRGRGILAFGLPVPELFEHDFVLPDDVLTEEAIKQSQRSGRRKRRAVDP